MATLTTNCWSQLTPQGKIDYLIEQVNGLQDDLANTFGQVAASSSGSIPVTAKSWSLFVTGANATIGGQAVPTLTVLSGKGPMSAAIALVTGATTTITYNYQS